MNASLLTGLLLGTLLTSGPAFSQNAMYRYPFAKGAIARLDAAAKLITISTADGSQTFAVTDHTYLFRGPDKITLAKLRIGETVKISYVDQNRSGDHIWWISDVRKFQSHFPEWKYRTTDFPAAQNRTASGTRPAETLERRGRRWRLNRGRASD